MSKKKKIIIIVSSVTAAVLIVAGTLLGVFLKDLSDYQEEVKNIKIEDIDISALADGKYTGSHEVKYILAHLLAEVEVTVVDGKITKIDLLSNVTTKDDVPGTIINEVIAQQTLKIGFITGATNSSKVVLKAIETALNSTPVSIT